jgi:PAS domain S-box-containing protein/putative nucleotidyltransferase with HDIG domain
VPCLMIDGAGMSLRVKTLLVTGGILVGLIAVLYPASVLFLGTGASQDQRYLLAALLITGLIFGLANRAVLNGFILSGLNRLSAEILGIGASGDLTARLAASGDDELARLARNINGMLRALEKSQQQRLESEQRYRAVVQETAEGIYLLDLETKCVLEANAAFQKMVEYSAEELKRLTLYDLVAHERESIDENVRRLLAEKRQSFGERKYRRKSGSLLEVEISASLITYGGRRVACVVARDVTQRKWAEDALRRNEAYFRSLIDNSLDVTGILNADGTVCYLSPAIERMLGFKPERMTGRNAFDMIHPDDAAKVRSVFSSGIHNPEFAASIEFRLQHEDGSWVDVETSARSLLDDPALMGIVFSMRDITARRQAEQRLKESEERYRQAVENSPNAIFSVDRRGMIQTWNRGCENVFRYGQEVIGRDLSVLLLEAGDTCRVAGMRDQVFHKHTLSEVEMSFRCHDGTARFMTSRLYPLLDADGEVEGCVFANTDITERKRGEEEKEQRANEFAALLETSRELTVPQDLPTLLRTIVERATRLLSASCGGVYLYDPARGDLEVTVATNPAVPLGIRMQFGEGMAGRVAQDRKPLIVDDYRSWEGRSPKLEGMPVRAVVEVPMLHQGELIGVLLVEEIGDSVSSNGQGARRFTEHDAHVLSLFAAQAAGAVHSARLLQETRRRVDELQVLHRASQALNADLSLEKVLNVVADHFLAALDLPSCTISAFDEASREMVILLDRDPDPLTQVAAGSRFQPSDYPWYDAVFEKGHSCALRRDDPSLDDATRRELETFHWRSVLVVPLVGKGQIIGLVELGERQGERDFSPDEIRLSESLASQAAVAIQNARLYEQLQEELIARKQSEQAIQQSADEFAALYATAQGLVTQQDLPSLLQTIVGGASALLKASSGGIYLYDAERRDLRIAVGTGLETVRGVPLRLGEGMAGRVALTGQPLIVPDYRTWEHRLPHCEEIPISAVVQVPMLCGGELVGVLAVHEVGDTSRKFSEADARLLALFAAQAASAVHNAHLLQQTSSRAEQLALLYDAGLALNSVLEPRAQLEFLFELATRTLHADHAEFFRFEPVRSELRFELGVGYPEGTQAAVGNLVFPLGAERGVVGLVAQERTPLYLPDVTADSRWIAVDPGIRSLLSVPVEHKDQLLGVLSVLSDHADAFSPQDERLLVLFANQAAVALENARLFEETRRRADQLALLNRISNALSRALDLDELLEVIYREVTAALHADAVFIALYDAAADELNYRIRVDEGIREPPERRHLTHGLTAHVIRSKKIVLIRDWEQEKDLYPPIRPWGTMKVPRSWLKVPMLFRDAVVGVISLQCYLPNVFGKEEERLMATIADQAAVAVEKARLFTETEHRLERLHALGDIDKAINSSLDLRVTLEVVLDQVTTQLRVDAADILLHNPRTQTLSYAASRGFRSRALQYTELRLGEGLAGQAALERRIVHYPNLAQEADGLRRSHLLANEGFIAYFAVPLVAKGQTKGVLEIFHRAAVDPDQEWLDFAQALASQAAIAIDDAELVQDLQRSNVELTLAYEATIEGWSRALEMRDQETEGHTARVTELTLLLARQMGMRDQELVHIRHGALLHDIGKMAVPDCILFKPGTLSAAEWEIMRQHPTYAYEMLSPIAYLRQALDVPYCHHEMWDGTGYPRGLKGEQIPLAARIFAVADVWDALRSDRPYRGAWTEDQVYAHIRDLAGKHFDPRVVEEFLKVDMGAWRGGKG